MSFAMLLALSLMLAPVAEARIHRSMAARQAFRVQTGFPHGRAGYVVDHVVPLACGGKDAPENMQWMDVASAKAKDRWEIHGDGAHHPCAGSAT